MWCANTTAWSLLRLRSSHRANCCHKFYRWIEWFHPPLGIKKLKKSKTARADEALTMAMELNFFLELAKSARSPSTVAPSQLWTWSRGLLPNYKLTTWRTSSSEVWQKKLNKALPEGGKTQNLSTYKTQDSRSSSFESNGKKFLRFHTNNTWKTKKQHNKQHRGCSPELRKMKKNNSNREPWKHC